MARLLIQYPSDVAVLIDGRQAGRTNRVITIEAGQYVVSLEGEETEPATQVVIVETDRAATDFVRPRFLPAQQPLDRFSRLYCLYNGVLLGQFVSLAFAKYGRADYHIRRGRMTEFLREIDVDVEIPDDPPDLGSDAHASLLTNLLPKIAKRSSTLAELVAFGGMLTHYGVLVRSDPATAQDCRDQCEHIRGKHALPEIDYDALVLREDTDSVDKVLSPSLAYLARAVDTFEIEPQTAFVIMPFKPPYSGYFSAFYRPSLERCGYRAFRAWGGLGSEDYCDLLLKLIAKSGIVWADVSERNDNVLYEIGAAHALGKLSMLVIREDLPGDTPANIGHDSVVRYAPEGEDWPDGTIQLMATLLSALQLAAERGERLRIDPNSLSSTLEHIGERLRAIIIPPEAREARQLAQQKMDEGDYAAAEQAYDEAIELGLDDDLTRLGRGVTRYTLEKYAEAEADLDACLESDPTDPNRRALASYFRGLSREQQENVPGARDDYARAIELGYGESDAEVFRRLAHVSIGVKDFAAAETAIARAKAADPTHADNASLEADLQSARASQQHV